MKVEVHYVGHQDPQKVKITLPNWSLGGSRESLDMSIYEAIQVYKALKDMFEGKS